MNQFVYQRTYYVPHNIAKTTNRRKKVAIFASLYHLMKDILHYCADHSHFLSVGNFIAVSWLVPCPENSSTIPLFFWLMGAYWFLLRYFYSIKVGGGRVSVGEHFHQKPISSMALRLRKYAGRLFCVCVLCFWPFVHCQQLLSFHATTNWFDL